MKKLFYIIALAGFSILHAQDLKEYIPYDATLVGSINGNNILKSVTINELDNSPLKRILDKISKKKDQPINSFNDFGIDTDAIIYLYHAQTDSLSYTTFLFPLKNDSFLQTLSTDVTDKGTYKMHKVDESTYMAWDEKKLALVIGKYNDNYFYEYDFSEIEAELAMEKEKITQDDYESVIEEEIPDVLENDIIAQEMGYYEVPYFSNYTLQEYAYGFYTFGEQIKIAAAENNSSELTPLKSQVEYFTKVAKEIDSIDEYDMGALHNFLNNKRFYLNEAAEKFTNNKDKEKAKELIEEAALNGYVFNVIKREDTYLYKDYYDEKKALEDRWTSSMVNTVMKPAKKSILSNKKYLAQADSKAAANIWNPHIGNTLSGFYSGIYSVLKWNMDSNNMFMGYGELTSNLYFEETQARIDVNVTLSEKLAKSYKRILDKKINRKFFNYINEDEFLGYMTYNINVKNTLEEYPKFVAESASPFLNGSRTEELELGAELFSLLLDEEAVSKVINGDAMLVLSGITEQEVTYTDYEYDEEYNYKEVEKTKNEKAPDFLLMISTEDTRLINNFMNYLVKKGEVQKENGYYKIEESNRDFPLGLYFTIKDGIFFLNTSETGMNAIVNNTVQGNLSSRHKKIINSGNYALYFNGERIAQGMPLDELDASEFNFANYFINNAADFYIKSSKLKNNKVTSEMVIETPAGHKNALTYMLNLIGHLE